MSHNPLNILICWPVAQEMFHVINVENRCATWYFCGKHDTFLSGFFDKQKVHCKIVTKVFLKNKHYFLLKQTQNFWMAAYMKKSIMQHYTVSQSQGNYFNICNPFSTMKNSFKQPQNKFTNLGLNCIQMYSTIFIVSSYYVQNFTYPLHVQKN